MWLSKASGIKNGAILSLKGVSAINVIFRPGCGKPGATTHTGYNETFSRPRTDLTGSSCGTRYFGKGRYKRDYDAVSFRSLNDPLQHGFFIRAFLPGSVANTVELKIKIRT